MVRVSDTLKQQNNLDTFPVAYGADIWLDKNKGSGTEDFASIQALYNAGALGGSDIEVTSMPDASASYLDKVLLYVGDTGTYEYGKFYKCVSDGETPPSYSWADAGIGSDPVDGTTIVKDSSTGELSAVQATQSTKGIVKGGNGTQIGSNGEVNVVDRLEETTELPTATADNLDKCYLLKGTQSGYQTGAIYQCQLVAGSDPAEYEWVLLSANPLTFDSDDFNVANDNVELQPSRRTYKGTRAAWDLLSVAEKTQYGSAAFTDDETYNDVVDVVEDGNMNAVTSNAVYNTLKNVGSSIMIGETRPENGWPLNDQGFILFTKTVNIPKGSYIALCSVNGDADTLAGQGYWYAPYVNSFYESGWGADFVGVGFVHYDTDGDKTITFNLQAKNPSYISVQLIKLGNN